MPDARGQHLIGHARIGVLLLNQRRNSHPLRGPQHRRAGIPAEADRYVGPEFFDDSPGAQHRPHDLERNGQVFRRQPPLQSRDGQPLDPVAQLRDFLHFHLPFGADKKDFDAVAEPPLQRFGHRNRRLDMPTGTSSAQYDF